MNTCSILCIYLIDLGGGDFVNTVCCVMIILFPYLLLFLLSVTVYLFFQCLGSRENYLSLCM